MNSLNFFRQFFCFNLIVLIIFSYNWLLFKALTLTGDKQSFIKFDKPNCDYSCNISLQFKPISDHGVLLYIDSQGETKDFIYVYLIDSQISATFSSASGKTSFFTSKTFATKYYWNQISIQKLQNGVNISFNDESKLLDSEFVQTFEGLSSGLFVGGIPSDAKLDSLSYPNVYYKPHYGGEVQNVQNDLGINWLVHFDTFL